MYAKYFTCTKETHIYYWQQHELLTSTCAIATRIHYFYPQQLLPPSSAIVAQIILLPPTCTIVTDIILLPPTSVIVLLPPTWLYYYQPHVVLPLQKYCRMLLLNILQYFWPALSDNWSWKPIFGLFGSGRFTQVLLYYRHWHVLFIAPDMN